MAATLYDAATPANADEQDEHALQPHEYGTQVCPTSHSQHEHDVQKPNDAHQSLQLPYASTYWTAPPPARTETATL